VDGGVKSNETTMESRRIGEGLVFLLLFCLTIPAANWLIGHAGTVCAPNGPCLIPVAPGLMAPSGVTMIGVALVLRDLVQRRLGVAAALGAIAAGAALSALVDEYGSQLGAVGLVRGARLISPIYGDFGVSVPTAIPDGSLAAIASPEAGVSHFGPRRPKPRATTGHSRYATGSACFPRYVDRESVMARRASFGPPQPSMTALVPCNSL